MSKAKYDNELYEHTKALINMALPMEWVIRAIQKSAPSQYQALQSLDAKLHDFWQQNGFNDDEIIAFGLKDHSWDTLQVGRICSRTFNQVYSQDVSDKISKGIKGLIRSLGKEASGISLPSIAKDYRFCDLLNGNDIPKLLKEVQSVTKKLRTFPKDASIPFKEFVLFVRVPTKIYNECLIIDGSGMEGNDRRFNNVIFFNIRTDVQIKDFQGILDEFTLEYCKKRMSYLASHPDVDFDNTPTKLITEVLHRKLFDYPNNTVDRCDSLIPPLVGLYYWDCKENNQNINSYDIVRKLEEFNIYRDSSTIRKDLDNTRKKIDTLITEVNRFH